MKKTRIHWRNEMKKVMIVDDEERRLSELRPVEDMRTE